MSAGNLSCLEGVIKTSFARILFSKQISFERHCFREIGSVRSKTSMVVVGLGWGRSKKKTTYC